MNKNCWHPLMKYIVDALEKFNELLKNKNLSISVDKKYDFEYILKILDENGENVEVFKALDITVYENFALFKYKNYIELNEMGYLNSLDFFNMHNKLYRECRSVVFDIKNIELVLAPQKKFFNVDENEEWNVENIKNKIATAKKVEISNKLDGSNQNFRYYNGKIIGAGTQSLDRKLSWRLDEGYKLLNDNYKKMFEDYKEYTFMCEYISPKNPIVVKYTKEEEGIYLFGMRNVLDGKEKTYEEVLDIGHKYKVLTTDIYDDSIDDIMKKLDDYTSNEKEGWVINIVDKNDDNVKAKLKINDYVAMHKAISKNISPNVIIKAIENDTIDDLRAKIPMAYYDDFDNIKNTICEYINIMKKNVNDNYEKVKNYIKENNLDFNNKKDVMITIDKIVKKEYRGYVRNEYLNKDYSFLRKNEDGYIKIIKIKEFLE